MNVHSHRSVKAPLCLSLSGPLLWFVLTTPLLLLPDDPSFRSLYLEVAIAQTGRSSQLWTSPPKVQGLSWLARTCVQFKMSDIRVIDMQPNWLETQHQRRLYQILVSLCGGTSFGLIVGLLGGISFGLVRDMQQGLINGLLGGTIGGLLSSIIIGCVSRKVDGLTFGPLGTLDKIPPLPIFRGSWQHIYQTIRRKLLRRLILGLLMGFLFGLRQPLSLLLWTIVSAVILGVLDSLFISRLSSQGHLPCNPRRHIPTFIIYGTAAICGVGLSGLLLLAFGQSVPWQKLPLIGLPIGLYFWFIFSGIIHLQHLILRSILCHFGKIPWDITGFLDEATAVGILQRQGVSYCFTDPCLQEILAKA